MPRGLWVTKVHINICRQCKPLMVGKFFTPIPCQRFIQLRWQPMCMLDQGRYNAFSVFIRNLHQHYITGLSFYQRGYITVLGASYEIAFPVPWSASFRAGPHQIKHLKSCIFWLGGMLLVNHIPWSDHLLFKRYCQIKLICCDELRVWAGFENRCLAICQAIQRTLPNL